MCKKKAAPAKFTGTSISCEFCTIIIIIGNVQDSQLIANTVALFFTQNYKSYNNKTEIIT